MHSENRFVDSFFRGRYYSGSRHLLHAFLRDFVHFSRKLTHDQVRCTVDVHVGNGGVEVVFAGEPILPREGVV